MLILHLAVMNNFSAHYSYQNFDRWSIQVNVLFEYQDILGVVETAITDIAENATEVQRNAHRESKKDRKASFYIH